MAFVRPLRSPDNVPVNPQCVPFRNNIERANCRYKPGGHLRSARIREEPDNEWVGSGVADLKVWI